VKPVKKASFDEFYYGNEDKAKIVLFTSRKTTPPLLKVLSKAMRD